MKDEPTPAPRHAVVITVSDGVSAGTRDDASGRALAERLDVLGYSVARTVVPDDRAAIEGAIATAAAGAALVLTTGGTGFGPRDVTPEATRAVLDREAPGLGELMRAEGARHTPMAYLSRATAGVIGHALVVNLPGSPRGALESLGAIEPIIPHALETMAGPFDHGVAAHADQGRS